MSYTVEIARFTLRDHITANEFAPIAERFHLNFLSAQAGYVRHDLIQLEDGWIDYVVWQSREAAENAAAQIAQSEASREFLAALSSGAMEHGQLFQSWQEARD